MIAAIAPGALLRLFTIQDALSGYGNVTVWLIVAAFLFARGVRETRLGERIAYGIVEARRPQSARGSATRSCSPIW